MSWYWDKWDHSVLLGNDSNVLQQKQKHLYSCQDMLFISLSLSPWELLLKSLRKDMLNIILSSNMVSGTQPDQSIPTLSYVKVINRISYHILQFFIISLIQGHTWGGCLIFSFSNLYLLLMFMISISSVTPTHSVATSLYDHILLGRSEDKVTAVRSWILHPWSVWWGALKILKSYVCVFHFVYHCLLTFD